MAVDDLHDHPTHGRMPPAAPTLHDSPPSRPFGDYQLLTELGRGGMGVVLKAFEPRLNRFVAIKMILPGALANAEDLHRFHTEASAAAGLQHPHIVAVHDIGVLEDKHYYSMDFIDGPSLTQRLADGPLPGRTAAKYILAIAHAIQHAHDHGILHRDLKPGNILLDQEDQPHVTDFGLAKQFNCKSSHTRTGSIVGTPSYMAPEQAAGSKDLGPACDIYGLGALLYELLTGRPPFRAETPMDTLMQVMEREPAPPRLFNPGVDRDLEAISLKCLSKNPRHRYATAKEVGLELERYLNGDPIHARSFNVFDRVARSLDRSQYDVQFRSLGSMLYWFAGIVFATHVLKELLTVEHEAIPHASWLVIGVQFVQFGCMGLVFMCYRPRAWQAETVAERQMWAVWIGYIVSCFLVSGVTRVLFGEAPLFERVLYPYFAVMAGMAYCVLGSSYWGRCYAFGVAFWVLAGVMLLDMRWAILEYGGMWAFALASIGFHLRRLGERGKD
jgi:Protein kinase domain